MVAMVKKKVKKSKLASKRIQEKKVNNESSNSEKYVIDDNIKKKTVLHIGCESENRFEGLNYIYSNDDWYEVKLTFKDNLDVDIYSQDCDLSMIGDEQFDAIWIPHKIDLFFEHEVEAIFKECLRILKTDGEIFITTPDLKLATEKAFRNGIDSVLYKVNDNEITPLDILYGFRSRIKSGDETVQHKSGYTAPYLAKLMRNCGFLDIRCQRENVKLLAIGYKRLVQTEKNKIIKILNDDINEMMRKRDALDKDTELPVNY